MKKLSFVLALVLALSCCLLASCGGNEEESSAVTSSADASSATSSAAASSEEASSEAASSEEASSEAASSEETSSEAESSEESVPTAEATEGVEPGDTNLALGATLTGADVWPDDPRYSASLNDGNAADALDYNDTWFGYWYNAGDADVESKTNAPGKLGTIVIDLGEVKEISAVRINAFLGNTSGILSPAGFVFEYSEDGENYVKFGEKTLESPAEGDTTVAWVGYTLATPANAQYVRVTVLINGTWTFVNEVEVY